MRFPLLSCRFDALTIGAIAASAMDAVTTYFFLEYSFGIESNPVLAALVQHSKMWVVPYLLLPPLLLPLMPELCRQSVALFFITQGILFTWNNLCGIILGRFVLVDEIGVLTVFIGSVGCGSVAFLYLAAINRLSPKEFLISSAVSIAFLIPFAGIEAAFYVVGRILTA